MIRYTKQRTHSTCGPTAIINAMKWIGLNASWNNDIKFCKDICGISNSSRGMWSWSMDETLKILPIFNIKETMHMPKLGELDEQLKLDRAIVIGYLHKGGRHQNGHFILCVGKTNRYYDVVNGRSKGKTLSKISRRTMRKRLNTKRIEAGALFYSVAWSIEKNKKGFEKCLG